MVLSLFLNLILLKLSFLRDCLPRSGAIITMHLKTIALVAVFLVVATLANGAENNFVIHMPGAQPTRKDDYLCAAFSLKNLSRATQGPKVYLTGFDVNANSTNVGHVGLFRCNNASVEEGAVYSCRNTEKFRKSIFL